MASAVLLAVRAAGADRRPRDHHLSVALHNLDEPERMEGRPADNVRGRRQLSADAERSALRRGGRPHAYLHGPLGAAAASPWYARGGRVSSALSAARLLARHLHHADDGDAGRNRADLDHDL